MAAAGSNGSLYLTVLSAGTRLAKLTDRAGGKIGYLLRSGERRVMPWLGLIERAAARALDDARPVRLADITRVGVAGWPAPEWREVPPGECVHGGLTSRGAFAICDAVVALVGAAPRAPIGSTAPLTAPGLRCPSTCAGTVSKPVALRRRALAVYDTGLIDEMMRPSALAHHVRTICDGRCSASWIPPATRASQADRSLSQVLAGSVLRTVCP